jgi:Ca-activated chloride channel family protein
MTIERDEQRFTDFALGELTPEEKGRAQADLNASPEAVRELRALEAMLGDARGELRSGDAPKLSEERRQAIVERAERSEREERAGLAGLAGKNAPKKGRRHNLYAVGSVLAVAAGAVLFVSVTRMPAGESPVLTGGYVPPAASGPGEWDHLKLAPPTEPSPATTVEGLTGEQLDRGDVALGGEARKPVRAFDKENPYRGSAARDKYDHVVDNPFVRVAKDPRSTFSIDVDTASYALVRRHLAERGVFPPPGAVRIEEMVNYFDYAYPEPGDGRAFSVQTDLGSAPWAPSHRLLRIGIQGKHVAQAAIPGANLVFLIDVSGSMADENKLPLLRRSLALLVERLRPSDRVAMVVYAGSSGLVLPSTPGSERGTILSALKRLEAGGSTNGGEGIELAYREARSAFVNGGVNRVILATDGDFNVGITNENDLVDLIERQAKSGVFLSVLGFGEGNYNDSMLEKLADKGNGNYAYIDDLPEARKVLVEQASGTLVTIAKDVKIQIEFNPSEVESFRLIGYENRVLAHRDFNDDRKDAGEIGAGHRVTALYEIIPAAGGGRAPGVDPLKYQPSPAAPVPGPRGELATVKLRYKEPEGSVSKLVEAIVRDDGGNVVNASRDFRFAAAVAEFGMLLRNSPHRGKASYDDVLELAEPSSGDERKGEFLRLVRTARSLSASR